jgi:hypothetical protein
VKAILLRHPGEPSALEYVEVPTQRPAAGKVLVKADTTCYGPQAVMIAGSFTPRLRYSGTSLGYQLASIIAGGPSPFIATALFATSAPSFPIALKFLAAGSSASLRGRTADGLHQ